MFRTTTKSKKFKVKMTDKDLSLPTSTHLVLQIEVYTNKSINCDDFI